ncbi:MAG: Ig-like domain-containing protein [Candidatus Latescibacterota bacterium]|nr:MAG: Ig-like domain-containing protein [Candidatus Latescibacterota bacterium]
MSDTITYYIELDAAPGITNGSDFTALVEAMDVWPLLAGIDLEVFYGGTTGIAEANPLDRFNLITFKDPVMNKDTGALFSNAVLAVGIATSFTEPTYYDGEFYRPGQVVDCDMLFNPSRSFKTPSAGSGTDLKSVATHEGGHLYGITHSTVRHSTMFPVLPSGTQAQTLEPDDSLVYLKAYPDETTLTGANRISGMVINGQSSDPVAGAAVFAIDVATGDTIAMDITTHLGTYVFIGIPDGEYYVYIHPLDGTSGVEFIYPQAINFLVELWGSELFPPEYWDALEGPFDDPTAKSLIPISGGSAVIDIVTNIDVTPPQVVSVSPDSNITDALVNSAVVIGFSEEINHNTLQGNFRVEDATTHTAVGGVGTVYQDGELLSFAPWNALEYNTTYRVVLSTGVEDKFGNGLAEPFVYQFTTDVEPPLHIDALVPDRGVAGSVMVITGNGFDPDVANNVVRFTDKSGTGTVTMMPTSASPTQLVVNVHPDAGSGNVDVIVGPEISNALTFTLLPPVDVSRGYIAGSVNLGSTPRSLAVLPNGSDAYVATSAGVSIVNIDPGSPSFLNHTTISIASGLREIDVSPDGHYVYTTSDVDSAVYVIDAFNQILDDTFDIDAGPRGVVIGPVGNKAYVTTDVGEIQIWDLQPGSATYRSPIKSIVSPDPNLRGKMAVDPMGEYLLALTGTGKLLVFDAGPDTFEVDISVGPDPRDVTVDPTGTRAYVSDGTGIETIISLGSLIKVTDITTGGTLRGSVITPTGLHLYAANRELNVLDVIDLNEGNPTYRTVATTHSVGVNPVDVDVSPSGKYAISLSEAEQKLVVISIGVGPIIEALSRRAGPTGTTLVVSGDGFGVNLDSLEVNFMLPTGQTVGVTPSRSTGRALTVTVPGLAVSGPLSVTRDRGTHLESSNAVYFEVLGATPPPGQLRLASQYQPREGLVDVMAMSPLGDQLLIGANGGVMFIDTDPNSVTYQQPIGFTAFTLASPTDIAFAPDGKRAFVSAPPESVYVLNTNPADGSYQSVIGDFYFFALVPASGLSQIAVSPDGEICLVHDATQSWTYYVDIYPGSPTEYTALDTMHFEGVSEIAYHPSGTHAFLTLQGWHQVTSVDLDSSSVDFMTRVSTLLLPSPDSPPLPPDRMEPLSLSFFPSGDRCVVLTDDQSQDFHYVFLLNTSDPTSITYITEETFGNAPAEPPPSIGGQRVDVSPRGDRAAFHQNGSGVFSFEVNGTGFGAFQLFDSDAQAAGWMDQDYSIDGSLLYAIGTSGDSLQIFDFSAPDTIFPVSGDMQTGAINQKLPAPLRVRVMKGGSPSPGIAVTFNVVLGGGEFAGSDTTTQVVQTNDNGYAEVEWILGPVIGSQAVQVVATGVLGSPVAFTADGIPNPDLLPLRLVVANPANAETDIAVTTTVLATFSRGVDSTTVDQSSVYFHKSGEVPAVSAEFGFTDAYRKVSLTPLEPLDFNTTYELTLTASVKDTAGGALQNPQTISFTTELAPPLSLESVSPPSAPVAAPVVLGGISFNEDATSNTVYFNGVQATPYDGGFEFLKVAVPVGAATGTISVDNGTETSNTLPFTVLVPSGTASDEVVATVGTGSATKSVTINPDGSMAYAVSPDGGVVIPINVETQTSLPPIQVGNKPISIDIHPNGEFVYVANFNSNTVSIIDVESGSPNYHKVVETLSVGNYPIDVVASPLGDRVYVATATPDTTQNLDIIDSNQSSANHHTVIATVGTGSVARSVTINPDGSRLYVGTDEGYIILNAADYSYAVIANAQTGAATKSMTINPDGSLLIILTSEGEVWIVDIVPGSSKENTVIAKVKGGSKTKSMTLNPDGTLLYLVQEENDEIVVVELNVIGGISVIDPDTSVPSFEVQTTFVDSFVAGEDPEFVVFDPTGSGVGLVTNSGPQTVTFLNASFVAIELPADSIMIPAFSQIPSINLDGFEMKNITGRDFTYSYTISTDGPATLSDGGLPPPGGVPGRSGRGTDSQPFIISSGSSSVSGVTPTIAPGDSFSPPPAVLEIPPVREHVEQYIVYNVSTVEDPNLEKSDTVFVTIEPPVPVFISRFDARSIDEGVELTWDVASDEEIRGFRIHRRQGDDDHTVIVSGPELIVRDATKYVDHSTRGGKAYEYTLGVVLESGEEALSQPVRVKTKAYSLALFQNYPNPFNPNTTISFTLPAKQHVALTIYNVEGKRVTTLVDEVLSEGYQKFTWNSTNAKGNPVSSGVYFYKLHAGKRTLTKKMVLLK